MSEETSKSLDVLGIKPVADAISHVSKATVDGAAAFLSRICLPAAEEFGLLLQDRVKSWRARNAAAVVAEAEKSLNYNQPNAKATAHPRLVAAVIEHGSWSYESQLHQMWGGLLASSCSPDGHDESNLIFTGMLSQMTAVQAKVMCYSCEKTQKVISPAGLIVPQGEVIVDLPTLESITGIADIHRLDIELGV